METPKGEPSRILLKDLGQEYYRLQFLVACLKARSTLRLAVRAVCTIPR